MRKGEAAQTLSVETLMDCGNIMHAELIFFSLMLRQVEILFFCIADIYDFQLGEMLNAP